MSWNGPGGINNPDNPQTVNSSRSMDSTNNTESLSENLHGYKQVVDKIAPPIHIVNLFRVNFNELLIP